MIWGFVSRMARHRHPQDRRTISLAGTSCTSGVVSGRSAASMAQRAICASSKPSDDLSSSLFLRFDFEWSNFATAITDGGILKAIMMIPPLSILVPLYFDQDPDVVLDLVGRAARLGVERFVLDDGWFHARRTDTAGLGDWWVDRSVWPDGLKPLADAIHDHGMQFGLWFEPEMVNPDSDLYREHPDWVLQSTGRLPLPHRNQQVLDLTNPDAFAHVFEQISAVLEECGVDYVKWDHNRDLLEAGTNTRGGAPAVHEQTVAYYRLLDTLRGRFPNIQWESCASGGGRIDLGVMAHGVVADDASRAIIAHVQYEESPSNRGVWLRVPGLDPKAHYRLKWAGPAAEDPEDVLREASRRDWDPLPESGPLGSDATITGAALGTIGVRIPRCHPETIRLIEIVRV